MTMKKFKNVLLTLFVILSFVFLTGNIAARIKMNDMQQTAIEMNDGFHEGKWLFNTSCVGCHNYDGRGKPSTPHVARLHGQHKEYLFTQIKDIQEGRRTGHLVNHMKIAFPAMTDAVLLKIAEYLESLGEYKLLD